MHGCLGYGDKFIEAESKLKKMGFEVANPCIASEVLIQSFSCFNKKPEINDFMHEDIKKLCDCDGILMLDNWTDSEGEPERLHRFHHSRLD